jgi:hypothetical protein
MNNFGSRHTDTDAKLVSLFALIALVFGCLSLIFAIDPAPGTRSAGLLWAAACCAVGCFLGFIFGIPRTLSSDTARTMVPLREGTIERTFAKVTDSRQKAEHASAEKNLAAAGAQQCAQALKEAAAKAEQARAAADNGSGDKTLLAQLAYAQQELADAQKRKQAADKMLEEKIMTVSAADEEAKKDQDELAALYQANETPDKARDGRGPSTAINTNLEQISDWLTKIIVGVSLVNSERVGTAMWQAATQIGLSLGSGASKTSLALAIIVYFSVVGLLGGYLLTRLFLQPAFNAASASEHSAGSA